ncbi:MAG TPA: 4-hydroxythreonine-4-phosphate dehydrogenase PdxA [Caldimonas sp.]|nr:4-hydroxythreonine-4-phosphate dehydrogenase PdxA [Caldimonas sp.]
MNVERKARLAVTLGDVRGIGPEIIEKAAASREVRDAADLVFVGPSGAAMGIEVKEQTGLWRAGGSAADAGRFAGRAIERSVALALQGEVDGIVTAPIDKAALLAGGYSFPGHTEMIATYTGRKVAMMLAATRPSPGSKNPLRVVLATTHLPLREVPAAVTTDALVSAANIARRGLIDWFGIPEPKIALCALNPHAGDDGRFGNEDDEVLRPAAEAAVIAGPFPADTVFVRAMRGEFDVVIAPYHDVGMTAIKVASFGNAVNVTLGLPIVRTSVDHGTALELAGTGRAEAASLLAATKLAIAMAG